MVDERAKQKIRGPFVPIITFFRDDLSIDRDATQGHAQRSLMDEERNELHAVVTRIGVFED